MQLLLGVSTTIGLTLVLAWVAVQALVLRPAVREVGDDGPGIPLAQQAEVTEAFQRGAASSGYGLGLAIVAQIAALHGASPEFSAPPGLVVRVRFG